MKSGIATLLEHRPDRNRLPDMSATSPDMSVGGERLSILAFGHDHFGIQAVAVGALMKIPGPGL